MKITLIALLVLGSAVFLFMYLKGNTPLNNQKKIHAVFNDVEGLIEATPLLVNGYRVGEVEKIGLSQDDSSGYRVVVTFSLNSEMQIPDDSKMKIVSMDLLGNKGVELITGESQVFVSYGDTLSGTEEESFKEKISEQLDPLTAKAKNLMSSIDSAKAIYDEIKSTNLQGNLKASMASIKKSINVLKHTTSQVDTIVGPDYSAVKSIVNHVNAISASMEKNKPLLDKIIANFNNINDVPTKEKIKDIMSRIDKATGEAKEIVSYIQSGKGTTGKFLNPIEIDKNVAKAEKDFDLLMKDAMKNPDRYFRVSIFAPKKKPAAPDSVLEQ